MTEDEMITKEEYCFRQIMQIGMEMAAHIYPGDRMRDPNAVAMADHIEGLLKPVDLVLPTGIEMK